MHVIFGLSTFAESFLEYLKDFYKNEGVRFDHKKNSRKLFSENCKRFLDKSKNYTYNNLKLIFMKKFREAISEQGNKAGSDKSQKPKEKDKKGKNKE